MVNNTCMLIVEICLNYYLKCNILDGLYMCTFTTSLAAACTWRVSESFGTLQVSSLIIVVLFYFVNEQLHAVGAAPYTSASH